MAGLTLAERLEARKLPPIEDLDEPPTASLSSAIPYKAQYAYPKPDERLFLALYTPWILHPLEFDWFAWRDYQPFLLGSSLYVLNTFAQLDIDKIFHMYLDKLKPWALKDFAKLSHFCHHLELNVPGIYQSRIEALIQQIKN